jgi:hypothetical protein
MARLNTEELASEELNFKTLTKEGEVRNQTFKEEFVLFRRNTFQTQVIWHEYKATSLQCTNMQGRKLTE